MRTDYSLLSKTLSHPSSQLPAISHLYDAIHQSVFQLHSVLKFNSNLILCQFSISVREQCSWLSFQPIWSLSWSWLDIHTTSRQIHSRFQTKWTFGHSSSLEFQIGSLKRSLSQFSSHCKFLNRDRWVIIQCLEKICPCRSFNRTRNISFKEQLMWSNSLY